MSVNFNESEENTKSTKHKTKSYKRSEKAILDLKSFYDKNQVVHGDVENNMLSNLKIINQK